GKLRELMASLSHDLRTPLTSLGCYLDTLQLKDAELQPAERRAHLALAASQHARLRKLIEALFELARLELPGAEVDLQPASISDLVLDVAQRFSLRAAEQGVSIDARIPDDLAQVSADVGLLERAFENLIENALRHTPPGGRVELLVEPAGSQVRVTVRDTGTGIAAEHLGRIFDKSYRIGHARHERSAGAGLGLAITRRIVELHGGRLAVRSEPGKGAAFGFTVELFGRR
ncbi:MAG: sensor histidine kinase, partial [Steroidobacteraceae bacterium]